MRTSLTDDVNNYYKNKILEFGSTPKGVDWNGEESQYERFEKLLKYLPIKNENTVLDFGCGYGALVDYFKQNNMMPAYTGIDLVEEMLEHAVSRHPDQANNFFNEITPNTNWDYVLLSGIFNVKGEWGSEKWETYITETLDLLYAVANKGIAFNLLTSVNDLKLRKDHLYYCDPITLVQKLNIDSPYSIIIDHSYKLWEFTVTILK